MSKFIWSMLVSLVALFIAKSLGWISFDQALPTIFALTFWNEVAWLAILAIIFGAVGYMVSMVYGLFVVATVGLGCLLFPVVMLLTGFVKLWAAAQIVPGFNYTEVWWQVLLISLFSGAMLGGTSNSSSSTSSSTRTISYRRPRRG